MIERFRLLFEENRSIRWGIELKENAQVIGTVGFHAWAFSHNRAEIGYELNVNYHGKGYACEALTAVISYVFQDMGLNRIEALVYPQNEASERLLQRIGFQLKGLLKQYAFFRDTYVNLNMFALLKGRGTKSLDLKLTPHCSRFLVHSFQFFDPNTPAGLKLRR